MVEFALKALTKSVMGTLPVEWHASQENIAKGVLPEEHQEKHLKGHLLVWSNIMERLFSGVFAEDSDKAFVDWLADYRRHLEKAFASEEGKGNSYIRGQIEAFNLFLRHFAEITKSGNKFYQEKIKMIKQKRAELDELQSSLDSYLWTFESEAS